MTTSTAASVADPFGEHASLSIGIPARARARMLFGSVDAVSDISETEVQNAYCIDPQ